MSDYDDDDEPKTVFLKRPQAPTAAPPVEKPITTAEPAERSAKGRSSTARLICLDTVPEEVRPDRQEYWLTRSEEIVGRGPENTVQILSPEVSREHARLISASGKWAIEDRGSRNGVWVNGTRVVSRTALSSGDMVNLGRIAFRFEAPETSASAAVSPAVPHEPPPAPESPSMHAETVAREPEVFARDAAGVADGERTNFRSVASTVGPDVSIEKEPAPEIQETPSEKAVDRPDPAAYTAILREHLPEILSTLVEQARKGDAGAARACLDYLLHEQQSLPIELERAGPISGHVKAIVSAMMNHEITPGQALEVLQVLQTATDLLKKRQD